ncbi:hypothetical protein K438DRAFT_1939987 [Mycena galopus ATCC 62051]|nr:hypothetical protein K438DRAFT_1939987 [Mycena galopus ATCC 62051]
MSSAVSPDFTALALFAAWLRTACFVGCGRGATCGATIGGATAIGSSALFAAFGNSAGVSAFMAFELFESSREDYAFGEGISNKEKSGKESVCPVLFPCPAEFASEKFCRTETSPQFSAAATVSLEPLTFPSMPNP